MEAEKTSPLQTTFKPQSPLLLAFSGEKQNEIWEEPKKALSLQTRKVGTSD